MTTAEELAQLRAENQALWQQNSILLEQLQATQAHGLSGLDADYMRCAIE